MKQLSGTRAWRMSGSLAVVAAAAGLGAFAAFQQGNTQAQTTPLPTAAIAQTAAAVPAVVARAQLPDFADLVQTVGPSVVNIQTAVKVAGSTRGGSGGGGLSGMDPQMEEFFRRFFGEQFGEQFGGVPNAPDANPNAQSEDGPARPSGVGSGFIISSDGLVMTNAHVLDGADEVIVKLTDKREFKAKVIGSDKRSDVALLKIDAIGLPTVRTGDVKQLRVGEWVLAIGSPFGLDNSVTAGIVSAKQRDTGDYLRFIQTDVAVNPGNSGGPLINMRGEVIGINSQIYSRSGGYMGISFSIPIDEALRVSEQLRTAGKVERGYLGVQIAAVSEDVAKSMGLEKARGALIGSVVEGSAADKAGVQAGDIVLRFNDTEIESTSDLPRAVGATKPGTKSRIRVLRRGKTLDLSITTGEDAAQVASQKPEKSDSKANAGGVLAQLGLNAADLSDAQKRQLQLKGGVMVQGAQGAAAAAGLRKGDVILALGNTEVASAKVLEQVAQALPKGARTTVLFRRAAWTQYAVITRPE